MSCHLAVTYFVHNLQSHQRLKRLHGSYLPKDCITCTTEMRRAASLESAAMASLILVGVVGPWQRDSERLRRQVFHSVNRVVTFVTPGTILEAFKPWKVLSALGSSGSGILWHSSSFVCKQFKLRTTPATFFIVSGHSSAVCWLPLPRASG